MPGPQDYEMDTTVRRCRQCESTDIEPFSPDISPPSYSATNNAKVVGQPSEATSTSPAAVRSTDPSISGPDLEAATQDGATRSETRENIRWTHWCSFFALAQATLFATMAALTLNGVICPPWLYDEVMLALLIHGIALPAFLDSPASREPHVRWICSIGLVILASVCAGLVRKALVANNSGCWASRSGNDTTANGTVQLF